MILMLGSFRVAPDRVRTLTNHARAMLHAAQDEDGCLGYAISQDIDEPGLMHIEARWTTQEALDEHRRRPHAVAWRLAQAEIGVMAQTLQTFDLPGEETGIGPGS